ncbi:MAG: ATP synthase F1 subunit delta [Magnetococcales bacterium]|nr:ATP synthase F1 subunit delta [Magnetococcales bacterium]
MHESTLAKRYATALAELAVEQNLLEAVGSDLNGFLELFRSTPALRFLLTSPTAERKDQHAALAIFLERAAPAHVTSSFLKLLIDKRRMTLLESIVAAYNGDMDSRAGRLAVDVRVLMPLSGVTADRMRATLAEATGKEIQLNITTDPGILGGMVVTMGSVMIDYSVRNHLNRLKASMRG